MSIILLTALIPVIVLLVFVIKLNLFSKIRIPRTAAKVIIIVYLGLLLISVPVLYFIPKNTFLSLNKPDVNIIAKESYKSEIFRKYAEKGELAKLPENEKNNTYQFKAVSNILRFDTPGYDSYPIWVEEKTTNDGIINVETYTKPYIANGVDVTKSVAPIHISYKDGVLKVTDPKGLTITMFDFSPNFLMMQFEKDHDYGSYTYFGDHAIYVKVPKGMTVESSKSMVTLVKRGNQ